MLLCGFVVGGVVVFMVIPPSCGLPATLLYHANGVAGVPNCRCPLHCCDYPGTECRAHFHEQGKQNDVIKLN